MQDWLFGALHKYKFFQVSLKPYNIAPVGKVLHRYKMLESTHDHALSLLSKTRPEANTVIMADYQTKGRGRWTKSWSSEANKNLLCSAIYYPDFLKVQDIFLLNMVLSLSVVDLLEAHQLKQVSIKWPNDILVKGAKIAGLLITNSFAGSRIEYSVLSLGLNINQRSFDADDKRITSMALEKDKEYVVDFILNDWFQYLNFYWAMLKQGNILSIVEQYNARIYKRNQKNAFTFASDNATVDAFIQGVKQDGRLILRKENEHPLMYNFDEIKWHY